MGVGAMIGRDLRHMGRHGLPLLAVLSLILFIVGLYGMALVEDAIRQWGINPGWTESLAAVIGGEGEGTEGLPNISMMDVVFGFSVLVTMLLVSVAFLTCYNSEMKKGTIRTLTLYPVSVLRITGAKLVYAAIVGLLLSALVVFIPFVRLGRDLSVTWIIFVGAYLVTLGTVTVGALLGNSITLATRLMRIRPTSFAFLLVLFSFLFTHAVLGAVVPFVGSRIGLSDGGASLLAALRPLVFLSSYHHGAIAMSAVLGGPSTPSIAAWGLTAAVLILGIVASRKLYPDIFEKE